jgi:hypothetical protein
LALLYQRAQTVRDALAGSNAHLRVLPIMVTTRTREAAMAAFAKSWRVVNPRVHFAGCWIQDDHRESLASSVPAGEARALKHFQDRMPHGLFVPDVP